MNLKLCVVFALLAGCGIFVHTAFASEPLLGALIGGGAGAIVGNAVGGRDGAIVGGALGAVAGAAIGSHRYERAAYAAPEVVYARPGVAYAQPRAVYVEPPLVYAVEPPPVQLVERVIVAPRADHYVVREGAWERPWGRQHVRSSGRHTERWHDRGGEAVRLRRHARHAD